MCVCGVCVWCLCVCLYMVCICVCVYGVCVRCPCVCVYRVCVCVCVCGVCVSVCICPGHPSPCRHPPGCCGAETRPTVCRGLSPTRTLPVNRRCWGPGGVWGAALVGGWGRRLPEEPPPAPASALRPAGGPLCRLPAGTQHSAHRASAAGAGELGPGGLSVLPARHTSYRCRGQAGAKPLGRKITPISALMAHKVILLWDTGAGLPVFCTPVTTPRREAWMTSYQSPTCVRKRSRALEQLRGIGAN